MADKIRVSKSGSGAPTSITPTFIGQIYIDEDTGLRYEATALTEGSWVDKLSLKENAANKKTDLSGNSDTYYPSQKAVKTAVDAKQDTLGYTPEDNANKVSTFQETPDDTHYPSEKLVKDSLDGKQDTLSINALDEKVSPVDDDIVLIEDSEDNGVKKKIKVSALGGGGGTSESKIYGVKIDTTNNNPLTSVTYVEDAIGMTAGSADWDSTSIFKDIKPCILKGGVVQYYLDPNDFTKKADGSASDITSGNDGDVMIEIPKIGYKIETSGTNLVVRVTDDTRDPNFKYYAHSRDYEGEKKKLYIGAYLGYKDANNKLRSLSGKTPTASQTIGTFRTQAQANGAGYDQISFYPLTLLQCLYLIKYKSLDSQTALGRGYVDGNARATATGGTNALGMYYGETTGKVQMKFAGIEDFWGNLYSWIDGLFSNDTRNILTAFKSFNSTGSGYTDNGQGATSDISGYIKTVQGDNGKGFVVKGAGGSDSTYFCDNGDLVASRLPHFGGSWANGSIAGAFRLYIYSSALVSNSDLGGRLMYL